MPDSQFSELGDLVRLARDKSQQSRSQLFAVLSDLFSDDTKLLSDKDREIMSDILHRLIHDMEMSLRRALADRLADRPDAPRDLVVVLANDTIEVAHPVLVRSDVLRDEELIEIIQQRAMEHQVAIATRPVVSVAVSDALVETDNEEVVKTLLRNNGAQISVQTMGRLVDRSQIVVGLQEPLVERRDLSPTLVRKLYWGVSAALRNHIVETFNLDPNEIDDVVETTVKDALGEKSAGHAPIDPVNDAHGLVALLRKGAISEFVDRFSRLSGLRLNLARRILFEEGGEGLAIICRALALQKDTYIAIFLHFRAGRVGDKQVRPDELSTAAGFFENVSVEDARAMLRRWQRDPEYLNALRLVGQR